MIFGPLRRDNRSLQTVGNLGERLAIRVEFLPHFLRILFGRFFRILLPKQIKPRSGVRIGLGFGLGFGFRFGLDWITGTSAIHRRQLISVVAWRRRVFAPLGANLLMRMPILDLQKLMTILIKKDKIAVD